MSVIIMGKKTLQTNNLGVIILKTRPKWECLMYKKSPNFDETLEFISSKPSEYSRFHIPMVYLILFNWQNSLAKDLEGSLILSNLLEKALNIYNKNNKDKSYAQVLKIKKIDIGKVKKSDLSRTLMIPRETTRRKLEDLVKKNLITINNGNVSIQSACFKIENLDNILKNFASCLNLTLDNTVNRDQNIRKEVNTTYLLDNFSISWFYLNTMMQELSLIWKKFFLVLESWYIFGTCALNQNYNLNDYKQFHNFTDDEIENFISNITQEKTRRGLNPTTISELTGVSRQTVVRNLKYLTNSKLLEREDETNLFSVTSDPYFKKNIAGQLKKIYPPISRNVSLTLQTL
jgi:DNA-binding MarR family transcriptional regulator